MDSSLKADFNQVIIQYRSEKGPSWFREIWVVRVNAGTKHDHSPNAVICRFNPFVCEGKTFLIVMEGGVEYITRINEQC